MYKIFFLCFRQISLKICIYFFTRLKSTLFVFSFNSFHDFFLLSPIFHNSLNIYVIFVRDINLPSVLLIVYTFLLQCQIFHFNFNAKQFFFVSFFFSRILVPEKNAWKIDLCMKQEKPFFWFNFRNTKKQQDNINLIDISVTEVFYYYRSHLFE